MSRELITAAELARRLGISRQTLAAGMKRGRVAYQDAARKLFDADAAIATWRATEERLRLPGASMSQHDELLEARIQRERAEAALAELRLRQATGELVKGADVHEAAFRWARTARDAFMGLADRIAAECAAETDITKVHHRIAAEVRRICEDLAANRPKFGNTSSTHTTHTTEGDEQ